MRLSRRRGGKRDFGCSASVMTALRSSAWCSPAARSTRMQHGQGRARISRRSRSSTGRWSCCEAVVRARFVSVRPDQRDDAARARLSADRRSQRRHRPDRRHLRRAGCSIRMPPGWCSPATCRSSTAAHARAPDRARATRTARHRVPQRARRPARAAVRDLRAGEPRAAARATSRAASTARANS